MSPKRTVKPFRMRAADNLAAERARAAGPFSMASVQGRHAAILRAEKPVEQLVLSAEGARPNNMAPSKYMGEDSPIRVLYQGIDSLWLNIVGAELREDYVELLTWAKEDAQASARDRADSPLPAFDGVVPEMWATGLPYYEWHLSSRDIDVQIRKPNKRSKRASAVIRVSAEALARLGDGGFVAAVLAAEWLRPVFNESGYSVQVGKVHIASDYQGYSPVLADMESAVKRAGDTAYLEDESEPLALHRSRSGRLVGISAGRSTNIRLNLYDKVLEVSKSAKDWIRDLWTRALGYVTDQVVWRVEFQLGREFLRDRAIESLEDLRASIAGLWLYGLGWYSFRTRTDDTNRSRWPVAPWWSALVAWGTLDAGELPRVKVVRPTWRRIAAGLAGYAVSAMAITGILDPAAALAAAFDHMESRSDPLGYSDEGLRYRRDAWPVLERKLADKQMKYRGFTLAV